VADDYEAYTKWVSDQKYDLIYVTLLDVFEVLLIISSKFHIVKKDIP
jgi:hypothetical protein